MNFPKWSETIRQECRDFVEEAEKAGHGLQGRSGSDHGVNCEACAMVENIRESKLPLDAEGLWPE